MFASARERSPDATALICAKHRARELDGREGRDEERRSNEKARIKSNGQRSRRVQQPNRRCVTKGHNQAKSSHLRTCVPAKPRPPGLIFTKHEDPRRTRYKGGRIIENGKASGARRGVRATLYSKRGRVPASSAKRQPYFIGERAWSRLPHTHRRRTSEIARP